MTNLEEWQPGFQSAAWKPEQLKPVATPFQRVHWRAALFHSMEPAVVPEPARLGELNRLAMWQFRLAVR